MNVTAPSRTISAAQKAEHFDVLIVGAGISGVGSAYHLTKQMPGTTFVVLEEQETFGGTATRRTALLRFLRRSRGCPSISQRNTP